MTPMPKFEMQQTVFYIKNGKAQETTVSGIWAKFSFTSSYYPLRKGEFESYKYLLNPIDRTDLGGWVDESLVFASKEDLIKNL